MKRSTALPVVAFLFLLLSSTRAHAQDYFGGGLLYDDNAERIGLDVRYVLNPGLLPGLTLVPNFDYLLSNSVSFFRGDVNGHYEFLTFAKGGGVYGLAGIDFGAAFQPAGTLMLFGLNIGAGMTGHADPVDLFGEAKVVVGGKFHGVVVTGGILFELAK
jgi:hypothetical protein